MNAQTLSLPKPALLIATLILLAALVGGSVFLQQSALLSSEASLSSCDLNTQSCSFSMHGQTWNLTLAPTPVRSLTPLQFRLSNAGNTQPDDVWLDITGVDMYMGVNQPSFQPEGDHWVANTELAVCTTDSMLWEAALHLTLDGKQQSMRFRFEGSE